MGAWLAAALGLIGLIVVVAAGLAKRVDKSLLRRGLGFSLVAALLIFAVITILIGVALTDRPFLFGSRLSMGDAFRLGALLGGVVAVPFFATGAVFLAAGLLIGGGREWSSLAWLLGPVIALVVGVVAYPFVNSLLISISPPNPYTPSISAGTLEVTLIRGARPEERWQLAAGCAAGRTDGYAEIVSQEEAPSTPWIAVRLAGDQLSGIEISFGLHTANVHSGSGGGDPQLSSGASLASGSVEFRQAKPYGSVSEPPPAAERWSGAVSWTCQPGD